MTSANRDDERRSPAGPAASSAQAAPPALRASAIPRSSGAHRDFNASGFGTPAVAEEDVDPMSGTSNLVDAMLVFACGLLLALVVKYDVPLNSDLTQATQTGDMTQIENPEELTDSTEDGGKGYEEVGVTYRDPDTGQLYVKVEE